MVPPLLIDVIERIIDYVAIYAQREMIEQRNAPAFGAPADAPRQGTITLVSTASTSRRWLPRSRYHIARLLMEFMSSRAHVQGLMNILQRLDCQQDALITLHLGTSMTLRDYSGYQNQWVHRIPLVLGKQRLQHVRELKLVYLDLKNSTFPPAALHVGFPMFVNVTSLALEYCTFATFHQLRRLICAFPALGVLRLHGVKVDKMPPLHTIAFPARPAASPLQLSTMHYNSDLLQYFYHVERFNWLAAALKSWLALARPARPVDWTMDISLASQRMDSLTAMRDVGHSLKTLDIRWGSAGQSRYFELSENVNLEKLTMSIGLVPSAEVDSIVGEDIPKTLKSLPGNSRLQHLSIMLRNMSDPPPSWSQTLHQWPRVVEVLTKHAPMLKHVHLQWYTSPAKDGPAEIGPNKTLAELETMSAPLPERGVTVELEWEVIKDLRTYNIETTRRLLSPPAWKSQKARRAAPDT